MTDEIEALCARGLTLQKLGRHVEAEKIFREALGLDPESAVVYFHLALCLYLQNFHQAALDVVGRSLEKNPAGSEAHGLKAYVLCALGKKEEASHAAEKAAGLDPSSSYAKIARAFVYLQLEDWKKAEAFSRLALELDPENVAASNYLAQALGFQSRLPLQSAQIDYSLSRDPENQETHAQAGWLGLRMGEIQKAEGHFLEALRLDPRDHGARDGLIESYRARAPFYRSFLAYHFWMQRMGFAVRLLAFLVLFSLPQLLKHYFTGFLEAFFLPVLALFMIVTIWVQTASTSGNLLVWIDPRACQALGKREKIEGLMVGASQLMGLGLVVLAFAMAKAHLLFLAFGLVGAVCPWVYSLWMPAWKSRIQGFVAGLFVLLFGMAGFLFSSGPDFSPDFMADFCSVVVASVFFSAALGGVPFFRRNETRSLDLR